MRKKSIRLLCMLLAFCVAIPVVSFNVLASDPLISITDVDPASAEKIYFRCETNKDPTKYAVGDEIVFTLTLFSEDSEKNVTQLTAPYFYYSLTQDDGINNYGFAEVKDGEAKIRTKLSKPGAVLLTVKPFDESRKEIKVMKGTENIVTVMQGGAIAGASEITTTYKEPSDFDSFWATQLQLLDTCEPEIVKIEKMSKTTNPELSDWYYNNYDIYKVYISCVGNPALIKTGDTYASGVLTVPKNAVKGALKLRLSFNGYGVSKGYANTDGKSAMLTVHAHSMDPFSNDPEYYTNFGRTLGVGTDNYGWSATQNATPEGSYFRYMLLRDVQGLRFMKKFFGNGSTGVIKDINNVDVDVSNWAGLWNGTDIETVGTSQGGFQAIAVAGLVPEVTKVDVTVPWLADVAAQTKATRISSSFLPPYAAGLLYYDTAFFAKRVKAITNITAGAGDSTCPMYSVQTIFNNLITDATLTFVQGRGHSATNTVGRDGTETKSLTIYKGDTYTLPFEIESISDDSLVSVADGVLTARKEGSLNVTYKNGIVRTFNIESAGVAGDINEDENVDIADAVLLAQYLAGWDVQIDDGAADCNGDGTVDIKDAVLLAQYLAGWEVELVGGKSSGGNAKDDSEDHDREIEAGDIL